MPTDRRKRSSRKSAVAMADSVVGVSYLPPPLKGQGGYDRRAATLDAAATAFLRSAGKAGRTHDRNYTSADRRRVRWAGPDMKPNETLVRNGGQRLQGVRLHGTGKF